MCQRFSAGQAFFILPFAQSRKAHPVKKIPYGRIFGGRTIPRAQNIYASSLQLRFKILLNRKFKGTVHHPARHHEIDDRRHPLRTCHSHPSHQPLIAEAIRRMRRQHHLTARHELPHLLLGIAMRRYIELIRLPRELRNPRHFRLQRRMDIALKLQLLQILVNRKPRGKFPPRRLRLVLLGLVQILRRHLPRRKIKLQLRRKCRHTNLGTPRAHLGALDGIVIDEHEGIHSQIQFLGKTPQIVGLRLPINLRRDKIAALKNHARIFPYALHIRRIVLGNNRQQNTARFQLEKLLLKLHLGDNSPNSILADNSLPKGVVKVEYGARLRPICDPLTGAPVVFKVGSFTLDYGGRVWCDQAGYIWTKCDEAPEGAGESGGFYTYSPGWPTSYNLISSYGGKGQKDPYGYKYAPFLPGSQSSTYGADGGKGGGAFVLLSSGTVSLSGLVSCRSTDFGYCNGAGGGIWIVGSDFRVAPCAELVADSGVGGNSYGSNYAGTGGRISLAAGLMDYDIAALAKGETPEDLTYTDSLDFITASANAGQGRVDPATAKRTTANRPGTITYVTRGEGTFVTPIPAPEPPPAPVYPDPAGDGQARTFIGEDGGDWDDAANWSPSGVPGNADAVTIDGKWVRASGIVHAASLEVKAGATLAVGGRQQDILAQKPFADSTGVGLKIAGDLTVAGDLSVGGADSPVPVLITVGGDATVESGGRLAVYAANGFPADPYGRMRMATYDEATVFNVAGALTIDTGATVYPDADVRTGASVHFKASSILLAAGGTINADARGFGYAPINSLDTGTFLSDGGYGCTSTLGTYSPGSGGATYGPCGGYGGSAQGARYGLANAPFQPGGSSGCYDGSKPKFVRGGGAVWLDAMQAELHGTITALGTATGFNASAGGGVWIVAKAFVSSPELVIQADAVRNGANGYSSYSAGGRIALGIALTEEEEAALLAGETPETVTAVDGVVGFTATVLGETKSDVQKGNPGTVKTVTGSYVPDTSVTIVGSPKNAVSSAFSYGASIVTAGSAFALPTIGYGSDPDDPLVRYSYDGWVLTDEDGNEVDSGEEDVSFTVPQGNSTLTILWTNVESGTLVSVPDATLGTVSVGGVSHDADFTYFITGSAAFTAVPASGAEFLYWVGEVPAGHQLDNPLTIEAGIGRRIQPVFRTAAEATTRAWTGAAGNGLWLDAANWSPEGVPGLNDTVTMAEGLAVVTNFLSVKTLALSGTAHLFAGANIAANSAAEVTGSTHKPYVDPVIEEVAVEVGTLTLADSAGLALGGQDEDYPSRKPRFEAESVNLSGASILVVTAGATNETDNFETGCGTVTVAGVFEIADTAQFVPASDQYTGGSLIVRPHKFVLGAEAMVNAEGRGFDYRQFKDPKIIAPGQGYTHECGAGYGGKGGFAFGDYGQTYGFDYAPIHPGSCSGIYASGNVYPAGGLIRIHAKSAVLNGTLNAKPLMGYYGGSSGGGVWVTTTGKMGIGATFAALLGGGSSNTGADGGGGRIALGEWLTDAESAVDSCSGVARLPRPLTGISPCFATSTNSPPSSISEPRWRWNMPRTRRWVEPGCSGCPHSTSTASPSRSRTFLTRHTGTSGNGWWNIHLNPDHRTLHAGCMRIWWRMNSPRSSMPDSCRTLCISTTVPSTGTAPRGRTGQGSVPQCCLQRSARTAMPLWKSTACPQISTKRNCPCT